MVFREAQINDIAQMQLVRRSVTENVLSDPGLVTDEDCAKYISERGKGWVCEVEGRLVGFAIADLKDENIWALFVHPVFQKKGIGKKLHQIMLDWYFRQHRKTVWLSTSPATRAYSFYIKQGWTEDGNYGKNEIKFILTDNEWKATQHCPA